MKHMLVTLAIVVVALVVYNKAVKSFPSLG